MTTAHRPTFDPARGKEAQRGPAYHQRLLPSHTHLKTRQPGQGGSTEAQGRDLRAQLLKAEAAHFVKDHTGSSQNDKFVSGEKRVLDADAMTDDSTYNESNLKRQRVLEETREIDADSSQSESDSSDEDSDEDETAILMRELEKIKKERVEQKEREEKEKAAEEAADRETEIATGNPLLNPGKNFNMKRRWDDDVVFKNQARGTEDKRKKEFVNDLLRSDFHKKFMSKYVR